LPTVSSSQRLTANAASLAFIEGGTPNVTASVDWYAGSSANLDAGLVFRATDANNFFLWQMWADRVVLYRVASGQWTQLFIRYFAGPPAQGLHSLKAILSGSSISVYWDNTLEVTTTDSFNINATKYGVRWSMYDTTSTYDNFRITGTLPPPPTRTAITPSSNAIVFDQVVTLTAKAYDASDVEMANVSFTWASSNPQAASIGAISATTAQLQGTGIGSATITATPNRGPNSLATVNVTPGNTIVYDNFSGDNGTALSTHPPVVDQVGNGWSTTGALAATLVNNQVGVSGAGGSVRGQG
jgi:hypothetical protein